jgi:hypothetical protein
MLWVGIHWFRPTPNQQPLPVLTGGGFLSGHVGNPHAMGQRLLVPGPGKNPLHAGVGLVMNFRIGVQHDTPNPF